ncbi:MAG: sodium-dependent transporter [Gammaproteobacteria bacterium]|nr:sodium-dependent transporter [Gammaproteobacteria bacterium]
MAGGVQGTNEWSSRWGFMFAAIGFSVGLGNIWRFPFVTGENGGAAFLIIYVLCAFAIGLPLIITELTIGRRGRGSPTGSLVAVARESETSTRWGAVGTLAIFCVFIILSYYTVLSGWTFDYFFRAGAGAFEGITAAESSAMFAGLMNNPVRLVIWNTVVYAIVAFVISHGVQAGIERAVKLLIPALFVALVVMVIYGIFAGDIGGAMKFLLEPDWSKVSFDMVKYALGQAFFSIGIGMAALYTFGSYLPSEFSIPRSSAIIIVADTGVALLAGFAIFPLVFKYGLEPSGGEGLIFQTLPLAFGQMAGGQFFGAVFFVLLIAAALSSCIGCAEAVVSWVDEKWHIERRKGALITAGAGWLVGFATIMSLGNMSGFYPLDFIPEFRGMNMYAALDHLAANILLLVGAILSAIFFGWFVPRTIKLEESGIPDGLWFTLWNFMIRFFIPVVLFVTLMLSFLD